MSYVGTTGHVNEGEGGTNKEELQGGALEEQEVQKASTGETHKMITTGIER